MKYLIIVKFKEDVLERKAILTNIENLFKSAEEMEGISHVNLYYNQIPLPNRYDLMIEIEMNKESLALFDHSEVHSIWKETYSKYIQSKVIFDY